MNQVIAAVIMQLILAASYIWSAFVITKYWAWFVFPAFGVVQPAFVLIVGLMFLFRFAIGQQQEIKAQAYNEIDWFSVIFDAAFVPAMFLFWGFVTHLFV